MRKQFVLGPNDVGIGSHIAIILTYIVIVIAIHYLWE